MRLLTIIVLLCNLSFGLLAQSDVKVFSLKEAIDYGLAHSSQVKNAQLDIAKAQAQVKEYTAIGIPKLNAEVSYNYYPDIPTQILPDFISPAVDGRLLGYQLIDPTQVLPPGAPVPAQFGTANNLTASATLSTLIFDGSYFVGLKAARGLRELNKIQVGIPEQEVKYNVTKAYVNVLLLRAGLNTLKVNIATLEKSYLEASETYKNGFIELLDVERIELSLANLKTEADALSRQEAIMLNLLKFNMGFPLNQNIELNETIEDLIEQGGEPDLEAEVVYTKRAEYNVLKQTEYLNTLNVRRYKAGYLPSLTGFASHQQVLQRNDLFDNDEVGFNPTTVLGLKLSIPIFDGFDKQAKITQAKIDVDRFSIQIKDFKRGMTMAVTNAKVNYRNAKIRLENQRKTLALAERIYKTTQIKYREGVGSSLEVRQAESELYTTQANEINALFDLLNAQIELNNAMGTL